MKRSWVTIFLLSIIIISCQKEVNESIGGATPNQVIDAENQRLSAAITHQTQKTYLNGYIINESSQAISGATVSCGGKTAITDAKGFFYFKELLTVNKDYALITVTKAGFKKGFRSFTPNRHKIAYHTERIMLQTEATAQTVSSAGGIVSADGIKLTFPSNAIVTTQGASYSGNVEVRIRYIDPASPAFKNIIPGMLSGLNTANEIKALQSLGMANVELTSPAGIKLEIASGKTVKMEMPASASGPATVPLWHFNESYGIWIQSGTATKNGTVYVAEVNHFSIWNIDLEFNDFELTLKFQTATASPITNLLVDVYRPGNVYFYSFYTDDIGEATLINCSSSEPLTLKMVFPCDTIFYNLVPVTQSRSETVTIAGANTIYTLVGTLSNCTNQPITNQPFQVFLNGPQGIFTLNGIADAQGHFNISTVFPSCITGNYSTYTTAFLNNIYYKSSTTTTHPGDNPYSPKLCDSIGTGGAAFNDNDVVNIPDINLQNIVRQAINKPSGTIYYADVKNLNYLDAHSTSGFTIVQSIVGLQYFTGLDSLNIAGNTISDISPLQNLTGLIWIEMASNHIADISPLNNLTSLVYLEMAINQISDITPLQNLTHLTMLGMDDNHITNLAPIQNLVSVDSLYIAYNQISNLSPLQNLTRLKLLLASHNQISNLSPLQNLTSLKELNLQENIISNITPLQNLSSLEELSLRDNQIINVGPLQNLAHLKTLNLHSNQITSIAPLINGVPALTLLSLGNNLPGSNTVPSTEITAFQASHPGCSVN